MVEIYYTRNSYKVTYAYTDTAPTDATELPAEASYKYGASVTVAEPATAPGYTFSGWSATIGETTVTSGTFEMPTNDVEFTGSWTIRTDLSYTVKYLLAGTDIPVAKEKKYDNQTFHDEVTVPAGSFDGYSLVNEAETSKKITIQVSDNVVTFYYYKDVTVTANDKTKVFGAADPELTATVSGTRTGERVDYTVTRAKGEDVDEYEITVTGDTIQGYYKVTYAPGTFTITAKSILPDKENDKAVKVEKPDDTTYNGVSQQLKPTVTDPETGKTLVENKDYTLSYSENTTDAGTVTVTITGKGNYQGTTETTYQITKRPVTVVGDGWAEAQVYNTTEYSKNTYTFSNVVAGQTATITYSIKGTNAGSYTGTFGNDFKVMSGETDVTANYTLTDKTPGKLTITKAKEGIVTVTGNSETYVWTGDEREVTGFTHDGAARLITVELKKGAEAAARGTAVGTYAMGLKAENFTASSPNYETVKVVVVDGELVIETINITVTVTVRGNKETVTFDGNPHTVTGYKVISAIANTGRDMGMDGFTLTLKGTASATGTEIGTYNMGLTAGDFTITSDIYRVVRVVVEDGGLEITPAPEEPTEEIPEETVPLAPPEEIPDEPVPQAAGPAWALINLILSILTVLASLLLLVGYFGKKEEEAQDENGNPILDAEGNSLMNNIKKRGGWRLASLVPAILSVIAFLLTENMRNPMILVDRWTLLMVIIAVAQVLVMLLSKKKTEEDAQEA